MSLWISSRGLCVLPLLQQRVPPVCVSQSNVPTQSVPVWLVHDLERHGSDEVKLPPFTETKPSKWWQASSQLECEVRMQI